MTQRSDGQSASPAGEVGDASTDLRLTGEEVTISYVADPVLGSGQFRLENCRSSGLRAAVKSVWVELGSERRPVADPKLFVREQSRSVDAASFEVPANSTMTLIVGFPGIPGEPPFGESRAVGLILRVDGVELQAVSPVTFERRIPR